MVSEIKAVLFDLDKTLYENDEELEAWGRSVITKSFTREQAELFSAVLPEVVASTEPMGEGIEQALTKIGIEHAGTRSAVRSLLTRMSAEWFSEMRLTAEADALLAVLDQRKIPYGIITNAPSIQQIKVEKLGLASRASCVLISEIYGAAKPHATIFLAAAVELGIPCGSILFVGDSPDADIVGARGVQMRTAWLRRGRPWPAELVGQEPEFVLDSLEEVVALIFM